MYDKLTEILFGFQVIKYFVRPPPWKSFLLLAWTVNSEHLGVWRTLDPCHTCNFSQEGFNATSFTLEKNYTAFRQFFSFKNFISNYKKWMLCKFLNELEGGGGNYLSNKIRFSLDLKSTKIFFIKFANFFWFCFIRYAKRICSQSK